MTTLPESNATVQPLTGCTLEQYAAAKRLPVAFLRGLGLTEVYVGGQPAVRIPFRNPEDREVSARMCLSVAEQGGGADRFQWGAGKKPQLYGLWRIGEARAAGRVVVVAGEVAAQTMWFHGIPCVALPAGTAWCEGWAQHFEGVERIYVALPSNKPGGKGCAWLDKSQLRSRTHLAALGDGGGVSDLHQSDPISFPRELEARLAQAIPWSEAARARAEEIQKAAWRECEQLAREPNILARLLSAMAARGVVGEVRAAQLIYLCVVSRLLDRPASAVIKGPSSGGKSYLTEKVLEFFPTSAYYALSSMSAMALAYSDEPLIHRMLVIYEAAGLHEGNAAYFMRTLLSEGRIKHETVEKTADGIRPRLVHREGPTGLLVTTTAVRLHPENETRLISIPVNDTPDQTRQVMLATARGESGDVDFGPWHALQVWLEGAEHRVVIPFGEALALAIPPRAVRLRRDFAQILTLISAHALLHQASRQRDDHGRVVAIVEDYAAVRALVVDLVAEGIEVGVPVRVRETVEAVRALRGHEVTVTAVAAKLGLDKSSASRRVSECVERGLLRNLEPRRGMPTRLALGDALPSQISVLPTTEDLTGATSCAVVVPQGEVDAPPPPVEEQFIEPADPESVVEARVPAATAPLPEARAIEASDDPDPACCPHCGSDRVLTWGPAQERVCASCHRKIVLTPDDGELSNSCDREAIQ